MKQFQMPFTNQEASIYIFAMRYAIIRATGASLFVSMEIIRNWGRFSERYKDAIFSEINNIAESGTMKNSDDWNKILKLKI